MKTLDTAAFTELVQSVDTFAAWPQEFADRPLSQANIAASTTFEKIPQGQEGMALGAIHLGQAGNVSFVPYNPYSSAPPDSSDRDAWPPAVNLESHTHEPLPSDRINMLAGHVAILHIGRSTANQAAGYLLGVEGIEEPLKAVRIKSFLPGRGVLKKLFPERFDDTTAAELLGYPSPGGMVRGKITEIMDRGVGNLVRQVSVRDLNDVLWFIQDSSPMPAWICSDGESRRPYLGDNVVARVWQSKSAVQKPWNFGGHIDRTHSVLPVPVVRQPDRPAK